MEPGIHGIAALAPVLADVVEFFSRLRRPAARPGRSSRPDVRKNKTHDGAHQEMTDPELDLDVAVRIALYVDLADLAGEPLAEGNQGL
jgi:hypothetical protein